MPLYFFQKNVVDVKEISSFRFIEIFLKVFADQLIRLRLTSLNTCIRSTIVQILLNVSIEI